MASLNLSIGRETTSTMDARKVFDVWSTQQEVTMSNIIHVSVSHMIYPVTEDVLGQVFQKYGYEVTRMTVFQGCGSVEASVQLQSGHEAVCARDALHGRNIYDGCCHLSIECMPMPAPDVRAVAPMSPTTVVNTPAVELSKPFTGTTSTCARQVSSEMLMSPMLSCNLDVVQLQVVLTPAAVEHGVAAVVPMDGSLVQHSSQKCPVVAGQLRASKVFDKMPTRPDDKVSTGMTDDNEKMQVNDELPGVRAQDVDTDISAELLTHVGGLSIFKELERGYVDEVLTDSPVTDVLWYEGLFGTSLTHVGSVSLFLEPCVESAGVVFSEPHQMECEDGVCTNEVFTDIGGLSLFTELELDFAYEVFDDSPLSDMVWYEELVDCIVTHIGGSSLFLEHVMGTTEELEGKVNKGGYLDSAVCVVGLVFLVEVKLQQPLSRERKQHGTDSLTLLRLWDRGKQGKRKAVIHHLCWLLPLAINRTVPILSWDPGDWCSLQFVCYTTSIILEMNHENDTSVDLGGRQEVDAWNVLSKIHPWRLSGFSPRKCEYQHDIRRDIMQQLCGIAKPWDPGISTAQVNLIHPGMFASIAQPSENLSCYYEAEMTPSANYGLLHNSFQFLASASCTCLFSRRSNLCSRHQGDTVRAVLRRDSFKRLASEGAACSIKLGTWSQN